MSGAIEARCAILTPKDVFLFHPLAASRPQLLPDHIVCYQSSEARSVVQQFSSHAKLAKLPGQQRPFLVHNLPPSPSHVYKPCIVKRNSC